MNSFDIPGRVDFSVAESQWLADLHGIDNDLRDVRKLCAKCLQLMPEPRPSANDAMAWLDQSWLAGELSYAAVIKYGRTIGLGSRRAIPKDWIEQLPAPLPDRHAYFKSLRDKFIAHSVNSFEDNQVFVQLAPQFNPLEVSSVTVDAGRIVSLSRDNVIVLSQLAAGLSQRVSIEIESESDRVLELARAMPISVLIKRPTENRPIPEESHVHKARSKRDT